MSLSWSAEIFFVLLYAVAANACCKYQYTAIHGSVGNPRKCRFSYRLTDGRLLFEVDDPKNHIFSLSSRLFVSESFLAPKLFSRQNSNSLFFSVSKCQPNHMHILFVASHFSSLRTQQREASPAPVLYIIIVSFHRLNKLYTL